MRAKIQQLLRLPCCPCVPTTFFLRSLLKWEIEFYQITTLDKEVWKIDLMRQRNLLDRLKKWRSDGFLLRYFLWCIMRNYLLWEFSQNCLINEDNSALSQNPFAQNLVGTKYRRSKSLRGTKSLLSKSLQSQNPFAQNPFWVQNPFAQNPFWV